MAIVTPKREVAVLAKTPVVVSIVVPLFNEADSAAELHRRIIAACKNLEQSFEVIFVDDGSRDKTFFVCKDLSPLTLVRLHRNYGQTVALGAGISQASGDVVVTLDGDLENDPADIPLLLRKLGEGYDIVSGWRKDRWSRQPLSRRFPSFLANRFISIVTGTRLHDHGCQLKAYRANRLRGLNFSGDMHRMIAAYAAQEGARVLEIPVRFEPRKFGRSKYNMLRTFRVLLDVLAFHFFHRFSTRPMHFFGAIGFFMLFLGGLSFLLMVGLRIFLGMAFIITPLPTLTVFFVIIAVQFILMGLLAEMVLRLLSSRTAVEECISEITVN